MCVIYLRLLRDLLKDTLAGLENKKKTMKCGKSFVYNMHKVSSELP